MIIITCKKAFAQANCRTAFLTAGMSRAETVRFVFSDDWCGLSKTAVFTDGVKTVDILPSGWDGDTVPIPHEILTTAGRTARVGVYGTNASGVVLPTVWATLGKVQPAAEPSGDPSTDPTLPVWAQLQEIIGDLADLTTKAKNNLVAAINEAAKTGSGGAGSIDLRTADGYIQYSNDGGATWENLIALADLKGEKGEKGDTGATGPQGKPGERGPQGETGPQGPQGETGPAGPDGPKGATGPAGPDGAPGKDGSPGKDGADGAPGQDGFSPSASVAQTSTGATITITDKTGTTTAEIKNGKDGAPGKAGTDGKDGAPGADGTTFTPSVSAAGDLSWTNDGGKANPAPVNLKGPQGETGPTGPQGETGPQGPTGATGPQGAPGKDYTLTAADKTEIAAEVAAAVAETSVPAPASAAVGQIVRVKAVDAAGKITQTEAVDLPTGGGSSDTWELITSGEMAEAAALLITTDKDGAALALKSAQIIVEGATSFARATTLRFEVDSSTDSSNREEWAVEYPGDGKNDNPDIHAVYIAEQNKVPILNAESPAAATWGSNVCKVQFAKKNTKVNGAKTYSFDPLTKTIKRIYVGNYMGNGKLGAGCKYQIWGIRA